jgi:hypothetical protein
MNRRLEPRTAWAALLLALGAGCAVAHPKVATPASPPRPESGREQEAWIESMHRTAPGVSWREIERENRRRSADRLVQAAAAPAAPTGVWLQRGPTNQTGRTDVTAVATDKDTLLVGGGDECGGLFSGTPESLGWAEHAASLGAGVQALLVVPGPPESWVVATNGASIYVSTNQGASWTGPSGLPPATACGFRVARLLREPGASRTVYLLLIDPYPYYCVTTPSYTLLRSDDGGLDFISLATGSFVAAPDIWTSRIAPGPLYLLTDAGLASSTDHGASFSHVGTIPGASGDQLRLAGSEAGAPSFYVLASNLTSNTAELFTSATGGSTWVDRGAIFYMSKFVSDPYMADGVITASISTPGVVMLGGIDAYRSTDGGATFQPVSDWQQYGDDPAHILHADIRGIDCVVYHGTETFFANTDGGTYMSTDLGATFNNIMQFDIINGQYYSTLTSKNDPNLVAAGAQDQGFQQSSPAPLVAMSFESLGGGDIGHLTSSAGDHNMLYAAGVGATGSVLVLDHESPPQNVTFTPAYPAARNRSWLPFILADPNNANAFYLTGDPLYRANLDAAGWHWTAMPQNFSGGGNNNDYLTALAISRVNQSYWYAASDQGRLWYSHNQGATWTLSASKGPLAHYFYGTTILCSPTSATTCYVGGSGYMGSPVYKTTDGGVTWQEMGDGLPNTLVLGLAFDDPVRQNLYAAADAGAFVLDSDAAVWKSVVTADAPLNGYWSVEGVPGVSAVRFGTYGRGIWDYLPTAAGCTPGPGTLCIDDQPGDRRWQVTSSYQTAQGGGSAGTGQAISLDSLGVSSGGLFWFFGSSNPEMLVKVLNGCAVDQHFWVFDSATTNVGFTVTVTDTKLRRDKVYTNSDGDAAVPIQDTAAFACTTGSDADTTPRTVPAKPVREERFVPPSSTAPQLSSPCATTSTALCIGGRFEVNLTYETSQGGGSSGNGHAIPLESLNVGQGGLFWFFAANNPEMLVKVLDGCAVNDKYWVFYAAGTNVGFTVNVLDTVSGHSVSYRNTDQTTAAAVQDTGALPCG